MRRILFFFIGLFIFYELNSQDIIYQSDGTEIMSIVIEITPDAIKYKNFSQQDGPIRNILIKDVFMIIYKDGTREVFKGKNEDANSPANLKKEYNSDIVMENKQVIDNLDKSVNSKTDKSVNADLFEDKRDGQIYKVVKIGNQVWLAENLNYKIDKGSRAYDNKESLCSTFGRLYNYETAKDVCPDGWHLPNLKEWEELIVFSGGPRKSSVKLKPASGWPKPKQKLSVNFLAGGSTWEITFPKYDGGFGAFPGGEYMNDKFDGLGFLASWWVVSEGKYAESIGMNISEDVDVSNSTWGQSREWLYPASKTFTHEYRSVRCIKN